MKASLAAFCSLAIAQLPSPALTPKWVTNTSTNVQRVIVSRDGGCVAVAAWPKLMVFDGRGNAVWSFDLANSSYSSLSLVVVSPKCDRVAIGYETLDIFNRDGTHLVADRYEPTDFVHS